MKGMEQILIDLFESQQQAEYDFCGEQRDWHLPRLNRVAIGLMKLFPMQSIIALEKVKNPYDN